MCPFTDGNTEAQRGKASCPMTHSSVGGQLKFTPDAGRLQSPALVPACSWGAQKDSSPCSVALDRPAQPYHEAPPPTHTLPNPSRQDANVGFPKGCSPHLPSSPAVTDPWAVIITINCSAEHTALLPQVPKDPEAHSTLEPLPPTHMSTLSTKVPKTLGAWTKLTHVSNQPSREDSACSWLWALKLICFSLSVL